MICRNKENIETIRTGNPRIDKDIPFKPAVCWADLQACPAVVISLRCGRNSKEREESRWNNPLIPVDLVIDHSVQVDYFGTNIPTAAYGGKYKRTRNVQF